MEPGVEAGIDRDAESRLERFVERHDVSVGECLDSRVRGNDGTGERRVRDEIHSVSVTPECRYRGSRFGFAWIPVVTGMTDCAESAA